MDQFDFINRANADYIERLQQQYNADPRSVEPHWRAFFAGFEAGGANKGAAPTATAPAPEGRAALGVDISDLVHSYRELGHFVAKLDPLGHNRPHHPLLDLSEFGLSLADLDKQVGPSGFFGQTDGTLRDLIEKLRRTYCSSIGFEYMYIADKAQREWIQRRVEPIFCQPTFASDDRKGILFQLVAAQGFEEFLQTKYIGAKRFSLEGGEALIPLMNTIVDDGAGLGVEEFVIGMAHRGRLNVLAHVMNKPYETILAEFEGRIMVPFGEGDGDVKYHLGYSHDRVGKNDKKVHVALSFNPSHLELVNPVVEGIVRAKQHYRGDLQRERVVPLLVHGDAAFCGQGIVQETLGLSEMPFWRTGGTIHIIINNQIGFTTMPKQGRFTPYPSDIAKTIQAPIFHVNADDPEACAFVAKLAVAFRQEFHVDVIIDLWCYRRHGHNEVDEPSFTQPLMYKQIAKHPRIREVYGQRLRKAGVIGERDLDAMNQTVRERLDAAQKAAQESAPREYIGTLGGIWAHMTRSAGANWDPDTRVKPEVIKTIGEGGTRVPEGFTVHPKLKRLLQQRKEMSQDKLGIDWGCGEMFALGSLVLDGTAVRFVGQDAQRGTFSHRHACLHDYETGEKYYPLANLADKQAEIIVVNTMLSELAVVGFEYGFSSADPRNLVVWEAQFGDFVNGAQPIIDQFLVSAESKWQKMSGLVMLLPHGYEGQGPEHSNAYMERFLSLCAEDNIQVCQPTHPHQYFHLLRRQQLRTFRKPLILFMPKSLLRHEASVSRVNDFTDKVFEHVLDDPAQPPREKVRRLLLCTGKIFFALDDVRRKEKVDDVAIVRVEQLYPYPQAKVQAMLSKYRNAVEVCWVQEEPKNRGAWSFMEDRLREMLPETSVLIYVGRDEAASPSTGNYKVHQIEEAEIITNALDLPSRKAATETTQQTAKEFASPAIQNTTNPVVPSNQKPSAPTPTPARTPQKAARSPD
jgi:2-oxoglutarate dehydrogenase E1 component